MVAFGSYEELQPMFTEPGLLELARIIKQARGERSYREFEDITGVSHTTIRRLELTEVRNPDFSTLSKLASHTSYSVEELVSIAGESKADVREYRTAEEAMAVVGQLSKQEAAKLAQMIIARLATMDAVVQDNPPNDGLFLQIRLMNQEQMAQVLRAIADRMSPPSTDGYDGGSASEPQEEMPSSAENENDSGD